ncbi:MAG: hypothetical protein RIC35_17295 [Marinoscillum sp.]
MRRLFGLFFGIFISVQVFAQYDSIRANRKPYPLLNAKIDLANIMNPEDPSFLFSLEFLPFVRWMSISQEIGFVSDIRSHDVKVVESLKYRGEVRLYVTEELLGPNLYFYIGGDYQYRGLTIYEQYILGYECEGGCVYYQKYEENIPTERHSYQLRFGTQARINRMVIEWDLGLGESYFRINDPMFEEGTIVEQNRYLSESIKGKNLFCTFRAKIGYTLFQKGN